jgi:hypothetical protein
VDQIPELHLSGAEVRAVAEDLELSLRFGRLNGGSLRAEQRTLAAKIGAAVPLVAITLPGVLNAMGPQASAAVRAQVSAMTASRTGIRPAFLGSSEAARRASTSGQAIRGACAAGRLAATKDGVTGAWRITATDLVRWMGERNAA